MTLLTIFADTTSTHSCTDTNCWTMSMMERMHHTIWVWHERKDNFDHWKHFHLICASNHKARREGDKKFDDIKTFSSQTENSKMNIGQILFMLTVGINIKKCERRTQDFGLPVKQRQKLGDNFYTLLMSSSSIL